ncbi:DUF6153 family protein [Streptomyces sp. Rer75]|uniref:DUF6153 family protein n=1 Tax=unclassified Streptomyces TaxID=2593676 RepID=UPI0015CFD0BD|nr:DUF6153 family protein [Streptomyces sp. Rer75]QLH26202.1 hypothetical protein HYQ63_40960 [Streptomyces sp. Rer75]
MHASGRVRAGGVLRRLLFVVLLVLGVLMMHSMGHPNGGSGSGMSTSAHASGGMHEAMRDDAPSMASHDDGPRADDSRAVPAVAAHHTPSAPMTGMDMASLCVAVLGAWVLTTVLRAALVRRRGPPPPRSAPMAAVPRPAPPSSTPDLTALSVLRI